MEEKNTQNDKTTKAAVNTASPAATAPKPGERNENTGAPKETRRRSFQSRRRSSRPQRRPKVKPEFDQKIIKIRRVTRVMAGGRRFSFSVTIVIGDKKGRVGVGVGKASDTSLAIQKAVNNAKKNLVKLELTDTKSIPYEVDAKYNSARISLRPNYGRGVVAGSSLRTVMELGGIHNVTGRVISRSKNRLNNAQAIIKALSPFVLVRGKAAQTVIKKPAEANAEKTTEKKPEPKK